MNHLSVVSMQVIFVLSIVLLFEGAFLTALKKTNGIKYLSIGIVIAILGGGSDFFAYRSAAYFGNQFSPLADGSREATADDLDGTWANNLPAAQREEKTRAYASAVYLNQGKVAKYFTASDGWRLYCPTKDEIQRRENIVVAEARAALAADAQRIRAADFLDRMYAWLIALLLAAPYGWLKGRRIDRGSAKV